MVKVLHYLNQFFGGLGGEDKAGQQPLLVSGAVGAGNIIRDALSRHGIEYATIICGDNYFHEQEVKSLKTIEQFVESFQPDIFLAGPAFNAGRYGLVCAKACSWVRDHWGIPALDELRLGR